MATYVCPRCKRTLAENDRFCPGCGAGPFAEREKPTVVVVQAPEKRERSEFMRCPQCEGSGTAPSTMLNPDGVCPLCHGKKVVRPSDI